MARALGVPAFILERGHRAQERHGATIDALTNVDPEDTRGPEMSTLRTIGRILNAGTHDAILMPKRFAKAGVKGVGWTLRQPAKGGLFVSLLSLPILGGAGLLADKLLGKTFAVARKAGKDIWEDAKARQEAVKNLVAQLKSIIQPLQKEAAALASGKF